MSLQFHNISLQLLVVNDLNNTHLQQNDRVLNVYSGLHTLIADQDYVTSLGVNNHREHF